MAKVKDMIGFKFGRLTVIKRAENTKNGQATWICECDCGSGKQTKPSGSDLRSDKVRSCGCLQIEAIKKTTVERAIKNNTFDLKGRVFNRLEVLYKVDNVDGRAAYMCRCNCEDKTEKIISAHVLLSGNTKSCGCLNRENYSKTKYRRYNTYDLTGEHGIGYTGNGEEFYFDLEDYNLIHKYRWHMENAGYIVSSTIKPTIKMHRLIMNVTDKSIEVDHRNGIRHCNLKSNLRIANKQKNQMNAGIRKDNTSGTKGVYWNKRENQWYGDIQYKNTCYYLGCHKKKEDAIRVREIAELLLFKEYSRRYHELKEKYANEDTSDVEAIIKKKQESIQNNT